MKVTLSPLYATLFYPKNAPPLTLQPSLHLFLAQPEHTADYLQLCSSSDSRESARVNLDIQTLNKHHKSSEFSPLPLASEL